MSTPLDPTEVQWLPAKIPSSAYVVTGTEQIPAEISNTYVQVTPATLQTYLAGSFGTGNGTVTSVSVTTANGVSGSVATPTTTPAISLTLGAITPSSVVSTGNVSGGNLTTAGTVNSATGNVTGTETVGNLSTAGTVTATGNVSGGNLTTGGAVAATGAISGSNFSGTHSGTSSGTNTGDVTLAGTPSYITISGQTITRNAVDLSTGNVTGNLPVTNLNSGTSASGSTFWCGNGTWQTPSGAGNVSGPGSSTDRAIATWNSTTGTLLRDNSGATITAGGNITAGNIGNITPINLDGNGTHVLLGNGTFGVSPSGGGGAMTLIATNTPSSGNVTTFSSIPSSYTHLLLTGYGRTSASVTSTTMNMTFNNDSASNYDFQGVEAGSAVSEKGGNAAANIANAFVFTGASAPAGRAGNGQCLIFNYANTTYQKTCLYSAVHFGGNTTSTMNSEQGGGNWRNTSAINRIDITIPAAGGNYTSGCSFSLYGLS